MLNSFFLVLGLMGLYRSTYYAFSGSTPQAEGLEQGRHRRQTEAAGRRAERAASCAMARPDRREGQPLIIVDIIQKEPC